MDVCSNDLEFQVGSACRVLDFTLYFEESILIIGIFSAFTLLFVFSSLTPLISNKSIVINRVCASPIFWLKLACPLLYVFVTASKVGILAERKIFELSLKASIIQLLNSLALLSLSVTEHLYSISPSTMISISSIILGLCQATHVRTLVSINFQASHHADFILEILSCGLLFLIGLMEETIPKRNQLKNDYLNLSLEQTSSFLVRILFRSLVSLILKKRLNPLTLDDLPQIPADLKTGYSKTRFLGEVKIDRGKTRKFWIVQSLVRAFWKEGLAPIFPRFIMVMATFAQVYLVQGMTGFVEDTSLPSVRGWALVGAFILVYGALTLATAIYWEKVYHFAVLSRSALVGHIFTRSLTISSSAARTIGSGAASTFMSQDVEKIVEAIGFIYEMMAACISIPLALVILWQFAGWQAMVSSAGFIGLILILTSSLATFIDTTQAQWMKGVDMRIKLTTSLISQMLPIKLNAYEVPLMDELTKLRKYELVALTGFYKMFLAAASLTNTASGFVALVCIGTFTAVQQGRGELQEALTISRVFTILTVINLFVSPLTALGELLPNVVAGFTSISRLQKFTNMKDKFSTLTENSHLPSFVGSGIVVKIESGQFSWGQEIPEPLKMNKPGTTVQIKTLENVSEGFDVKGKEMASLPPVLTAISLELLQNKLYMVVGPVSSGKSSLLHSILEETVIIGGYITINARTTAFASQSPFIFPGSIRSNIIMQSSYDVEWYNQVIDACALLQDLQSFYCKDQTILGDGGHTLSGGQRQRVALARAVYSRAELVLLDDCFSALDGTSEQQVFRALFGPAGLLSNSTTVLVTHNINHLHAADGVIILESGEITHFGSLEDLQEPQPEFIRSAASATFHSTPSTTATIDQMHTEPSINELVDDETLEQLSLGWKSYQFFFKSGGSLRYLLCLALLVTWTGLNLTVQGIWQAFAQKATAASLPTWMAGLTGLCIANVSSLIIAFVCFVVVQMKYCSPAIFNSELVAVFSAPPSFTINTASGKILNRFSADIQQLDFQFPLAVLALAVAVCQVLGTIIIFVISTPYIALVVGVIAPIYYLIARLYLRTSVQLQKLEFASKSPLYTLFSTTMSSLTTVRAYKAEAFFHTQNDFLLNQSQAPFYFRYRGISFLRVCLAFITFLIAVGISALAVGLRGSTSAGFLGLSLSNLTTIVASLNMLIMAYASAENGLVSIARIHEFASIEPEKSFELQKSGFSKTTTDAWPSKGAVEFKDYSMRFKEDQEPVLNNISFKIGDGTKLGICGRSGSGKSTAILSLFRAVDPTLASGTMEIDGRDISQIGLEELRSSLSIVTQEPFLWHSTLRSNLDPLASHPDSELWDAISTVGLCKTVESLPGKFDWIVEDSESFSKGQRQLLCLARALLRKRKVLVLDESTSSVDHITDEKIKSVIEHELNDTTIISVAHRISTIISFDRILVMDKGRVAEFGTPDELLRQRDSMFSALALSQGVHPYVDTAIEGK